MWRKLFEKVMEVVFNLGSTARLVLAIVGIGLVALILWGVVHHFL